MPAAQPPLAPAPTNRIFSTSPCETSTEKVRCWCPRGFNTLPASQPLCCSHAARFLSPLPGSSRGAGPAAGTSSSALAPPSPVSQPLGPVAVSPRKLSPSQRCRELCSELCCTSHKEQQLPSTWDLEVGVKCLFQPLPLKGAVQTMHWKPPCWSAAFWCCVGWGCSSMGAPPAQGTVPGTSPAPGRLLQSGTDVWVSAQLPRHLVNREMG